MPPDVPQEIEVVQSVQPFRIVQHHGRVVCGVIVEKGGKGLLHARNVRIDGIGIQQRTLVGPERGVTHFGRTASHQGNRCVAGLLEPAQDHDVHLVANMQRGRRGIISDIGRLGSGEQFFVQGFQVRAIGQKAPALHDVQKFGFCDKGHLYLSLGLLMGQPIEGGGRKEKGMKRLRDKSAIVTALGAMSGTSLDGVDAAIVETDGVSIHGFGRSDYLAYDSMERSVLRAGLGKWEGPEVEAAGRTVQAAHAALLADFPEAEIVGFHGQTLAHAPREQGTLQVGDGQALADLLGRPVVWDFRSTDVELGGEGAPLAPFFHHACARWIGATAPVAFLNLGGVGNLTWVDPNIPQPEAEGALLAFDTGPANAPINDLMQSRRRETHDADGALAAQGEVDLDLVEIFLKEGFFSRMPPKSLDRNDFFSVRDLVSDLDDADAAATLTAMAAAAVAKGMEFCPAPPGRLLVTGGGRHNPVLMEMLRVSSECPVMPVEDVGLDGDMLEAQAFAYLAVRVARGLPTSSPATTGVRLAVAGGLLSFPKV